METLFTSPAPSPPATDRTTDLSNDIQSKDHYNISSSDLQSKDHYSGANNNDRDMRSSEQNNDPCSGSEKSNDPYSGSEKTPSISQPSTPTNQYSSMKPPMKSSIPNHLKPNTIWHTAALPR